MPQKRWSKIVEEAGVQVRIYERANSSSLSYEVRRDGRKRRRSLKTRDRALAEERARRIARGIARAELTGERLDSLTLADVFAQYFRHRGPQLSKRWRKAAETRRGLFLRAWGADKAVADIGQADVDHYASLRLDGKIHPKGSNVTDGVRAGTVEADIRWLSTVFRWARGLKVNGRPLVAANPLEGLKRPQETNVRRPIASHDRYRKTMEKADQVDEEGRLRCMLALARYTGRRENAICRLRADDVLRDPAAVARVLAEAGLDESAAEHFPHGGLRWRAQSDKMGLESVTPLSQPARAEVDRYLERSPRVGAVPLFPAPRDETKPMRKDTAGRWLMKAEELAKLPKLAGGRWHPYRRLFATELRALPIHDVAAAGGWRSIETVQRIYQRAEADGVLSAVQHVGQRSG